MATNVFELLAKLLLDTTPYEEKLGAAKDLASKVGGGIQKGFKVMATAAGAAFTAAGAATAKFVSDSVQSGMAFDKSMSQVAATMGYSIDQINDATSEEAQSFAKLRDFAREMGKSTSFSATQAADALNYMALAGYDADTSISMLPNVLNLAAAGGIELADASDMVTDASSALGLTLEDTSIMVDQMAAAASNSNTSVAQLGSAILTIGGTAKSLAGGTTELSTALGLLADNGIKGAEGGTALRNILLNLTPKSDDAAEAMERIGLRAYDAEGNMRPLQEIFTEMSASMEGMSDLERKNILGEIFNKVDLKSVEALLGTTNDRWNELTASIEDSENAAANMAETQLDNLAGDITIFQSALEGAEGEISDKLSPTLREFVQFGTASIGKLTDAFSKDGLEGAIAVLPEILNEGIGMISGILPQAIKVVQEVASALAGNLPTIVQSVLPSLLSGLLEVMKSLMKSVPSLLSTVFQTVGQVFGGDTVDSLFQAVQDMLDGVFDAIGQNFTQGNVAKVLSWILDLIAHVSDMIGNNIGTIIDVAAQIIDAFVDSFYSPEIVTKIVETATGIITALVEGLTSGDHLQKLLDAALNITLKMQEVFMQPEVLEALTEAGTTILFELVKGILQALPQIANSLAKFCESVVDFVVNYDWIEAGEGFIDGFVQGFGNIDWSFIDDVEQKWVDFWDSVVAYWTPILEGWSNFWQGYGEYIYDAIHDILQKWNDFWHRFGEYIYDGVNSVKKRFTDMKNNIVNTLANIVSSVLERASTIKNTIVSRVSEAVSFIKNLPNQAKTWGRDMIQNFVNGITSMVSRAADAARNIAQTIASYIHFSEPDVGPLADFSTYAPDMIDTFVKGIEDNKNKIGAAMDDALSIGTLDISPVSSQVSGYDAYSAGQSSTPDAVLDVLRSILTELQKGHQVVLNTDMINRALGQTQVYAERGEVV